MQHARVAVYQVKPGTAGEIARIAQAEISAASPALSPMGASRRLWTQ